MALAFQAAGFILFCYFATFLDDIVQTFQRCLVKFEVFGLYSPVLFFGEIDVLLF